MLTSFPFTRTGFLGLCRQALRFIVPVDCLACGVGLQGDPVPGFCRRCWELILPLKGPCCALCSQPFVSAAAVSNSPNHHCQDCLEHRPAFSRAWTLYPYLPPLREAVCAFKYRGKIGLAKPLAQLMIDALPPNLDVDLVLPVPLHPSRLRGREFNQSLLLADRVARHLHLPVSIRELARVHATDPQTTLPRNMRLKNVRHAFAVRRPRLVTGRRILLIDDVFTTGATLHECAAALSESGAKSVVALTLARTIGSLVVPDHLFVEEPFRSPSVLGL
ncbi:putative Phosphoribosyltransferase [Nitrospira japonica]|uniref:Putative Phosphoribosyltransferase n=1 Tax=Nitrospira japonica TaxID=1325564 RepID=A0A1W1I5H0_9BACT|nr:ComF family protein [Nitrospira japonica]SLM48267.1 putative Phosphoribosyltransferase [Nitrospira japonica]